MNKAQLAEENDALLDLLEDIDDEIELPRHLQDRVGEYIGCEDDGIDDQDDDDYVD